MKKFIWINLIVFFNLNFIYGQTNWRFAVLGDTHVGSSDTVSEMIPYILQDSVDFVVVVGDLAEGGLGTPGTQLLQELENWKTIFAPIYAAGIPVYGIRGNHEDDANNDINMWNTAFSGSYAFPQNGPVGETNLTYSFTHKNAKLIMLDVYKNIHQVNQTWLDQELANNTSQHIFTFGHEAAFKVFHGDCLDDSLAARDQFWTSLKTSGCKVYFCGHDHFLDAALVDDGDGNVQNDIYQYLVGTGGGWLMSQYSNYNGNNSSFSPNRIFHEMEFGYSIVEINGETNTDCNVRISWKKRIFDTITQTNSYTESPFVIEYSNCNSTKVEENLTPSFSFYPNPVVDEIYLINNLAELTIYDLIGNKIISIPKNSNKIQLNHLTKGLYIISDGESSALFHKN